MPLDKQRHLRYWQRCHRTLLPTQYTSHDSTRMALAFFIIAAIDLISPPTSSGEPPYLTRKDRSKIRSWVLSLQHPGGGFCGSPTHASPAEARKHTAQQTGTANLAATYFALLLLALAAEGDGRHALDGVNRRETLRWLRRLQRQDGSFGEVVLDDGSIAGGRDMRYCYLAAVIRWCLRGDAKEGAGAWVEDIDVDGLVEHIRCGQTFDGGVSESSQHEAHAGYAYCAVGALYMLGRPLEKDGEPEENGPLDRGIPHFDALVKFLVDRQFAFLESPQGHGDDSEDDQDSVNFALPSALEDLSLEENTTFVGFNGRCNKVADTCYCWWVGGTLSVNILSVQPARNFLLSKTQHLIGGFSKYPGGPPDIYHSYLGLAALATMGDATLKGFDAPLCVSAETVRKLEAARRVLVASDEARGTWAAKSRSTADAFWKGKEPVWVDKEIDADTRERLRQALHALR
ncbi:type-1 proteins geranylgeranyltransferase subunit beta [Sodiomyces alkalinus F11]|uniref:Type-1 proteins geranylgeranyltransferase subunit beta n=1 Tax=Sodiomyces alkalinus (strain CBS 110278 / VKM F-3762 / F11) TaxID=1314773 RepID=A0A3N2PRD2_SODAK|nr:type-1 proteins geranylgeranyltransferase subunit beta [Sodiomyces alkalinus F11]ROT37057.1 type-1 proteins geranylgeranyltransferase subunit beta [Sodiomyces alkalinus F11]